MITRNKITIHRHEHTGVNKKNSEAQRAQYFALLFKIDCFLCIITCIFEYCHPPQLSMLATAPDKNTCLLEDIIKLLNGEESFYFSLF